SEFRSRNVSGKDLTAIACFNWLVDHFRRFHLWCRQTRRIVGTFASKHLGIEFALHRILDQSILNPIDLVTAVYDCLMDQRVFSGWNESVRLFKDSLVYI